MKFAGAVWRYVPRGKFPLDAGHIIIADGRWNRPGEYGCLYTAMTRDGVLAEYHKVLKRTGLKPNEDRERDLVKIHVSVKPVLDLTDPDVLSSLGLTEHDVTADTSVELCRMIADNARASSYCAIISPSAALQGEKNLNVYLDVSHRHLRLEVSSDSEPLNYRP